METVTASKGQIVIPAKIRRKMKALMAEKRQGVDSI